MGLVYADIEILSSFDLQLFRRGKLAHANIKRVALKALVDRSTYMLLINETIKAQLDLTVVDEQIIELADGSHVRLEVAEPVDVRFANRSTSARALVRPGNAEVVLGAMPFGDLDVVG